MTLKTPHEVKQKLPLKTLHSTQISRHRITIESILQREDSRFALILGPCSLHDAMSAKDYAKKLSILQKKVEKSCFLVMRAHIEKPRTLFGWKGLLYDPYLDGSNDLEAGLSICRSLLLEIVETGIPIALEFLDPLTPLYFSDLVSWGFIGARTSSSQIHRQLASILSMPVGFKNAVDGNVEEAILGALVAQGSHTFPYMDENGKLLAVTSQGNPFSHIVLRGSMQQANYTSKEIQKALSVCSQLGLNTPLIVDCAHGNCQKNPLLQKEAFYCVLNQYLEGNDKIIGLMIESHLEEGKQPFSKSIHPAISLTDPCIGWETTEEWVLSIHEALQTRSMFSYV
jgi:3-deoxy-7-phosphoheptulonate synthase